MPLPSSKSSVATSPVDATFREVPASQPAGSPAAPLPARLQLRRVRAPGAVSSQLRRRAAVTAPGKCPFCGKPAALGEVEVLQGISVKACSRCGSIGRAAMVGLGWFLRR